MSFNEDDDIIVEEAVRRALHVACNALNQHGRSALANEYSTLLDEIDHGRLRIKVYDQKSPDCHVEWPVERGRYSDLEPSTEWTSTEWTCERGFRNDLDRLGCRNPHCKKEKPA